VPPPNIYKQGNPPDQSLAQGLIGPIPWVDDLWVDITNHLVKRCAAINPYVWTSIEGSGGGASVNDPFLTTSFAADLTNQTVAGPFLQTVLTTSLPFARGGTVINPLNSQNIIVWRAPFSCTVSAVKGYTSGATGSTVNARLNGSFTHLALDLVLGVADTWIDGGAVQNTAYSAGDKLEIMFTGISGTPTELAVQVEFTRP